MGHKTGLRRGVSLVPQPNEDALGPYGTYPALWDGLLV
jgi:hypothetical protein